MHCELVSHQWVRRLGDNTAQDEVQVISTGSLGVDLALGVGGLPRGRIVEIGVMFGSPETTTGGNALKFYASARLDIRRIGQLKENDKVVGGRTKVKVVKNKLAAPFREVEFDVGYGTSISRLGEVIDVGVVDGIIEKSGSWFSYKEGRLGQGRESAIRFLAGHPEVDAELSRQILANSLSIHPKNGSNPNSKC